MSIAYIAPRYRDTTGATAFAAVLADTITWTPEQFGNDYAWDAPIPAAADMQREADALQRHLASL